MEEKNILEKIHQVEGKLDRLLEFVELQNRKKEEFDDLVTDVSIVAKDAFRNSVMMLDKAQVELDNCDFSCLIIKILQNLDTFHEMLDMMESVRDFMKDVTPIIHQVGLDAVHKMNDLDQKGYFDYIGKLAHLVDTWIRVFPIEDLQKTEDNLAAIAGILRNLSDPALLAALNKITRIITDVKMEDEKDILSLWQILMKLRSKEVRKSISYSLKVVKEIAI
jgi:uncharacterized protein YjgD (DUF1641 family)